MKYKIFIRVLLLLIVSAQTFAETPDGTIPFDCPDIPNPTFQFHFTRELIMLAVTTAPFNSVDDLYIHIYDDEAGIYDTLAHYYGETLKAKNWHDIQEDERGPTLRAQQNRHARHKRGYHFQGHLRSRPRR